MAVIELKDLQQIVTSSLDGLNINEKDPMSTVYKFFDKYGILNGFYVKEEGKQYLKDLGLWSLLKQAGLALEGTEPLDFMKTFWLYIGNDYADYEALTKECFDFVESRDLKTRMPNMVFFKNLNSYAQYKRIESELIPYRIKVMYYNATQEVDYILSCEFDNKHYEENPNVYVFDYENPKYKQCLLSTEVNICYPYIIECAEDLIEKMKSEGKSMLLFSKRFESSDVAIALYIYYSKSINHFKVLTSLSDIVCNRFCYDLVEFESCNWEFIENKLKIKSKIGFRIMDSPTGFKFVYISKHSRRLELTGITFDSYESYIKSNMPKGFKPESNKFAPMGNKELKNLKVIPIYEALALREIKTTAKVGSEEYEKLNNEFNKMCNERILPAIKLLETITGELVTLGDLIAVEVGGIKWLCVGKYSEKFGGAFFDIQNPIRSEKIDEQLAKGNKAYAVSDLDSSKLYPITQLDDIDEFMKSDYGVTLRVLASELNINFDKQFTADYEYIPDIDYKCGLMNYLTREPEGFFIPKNEDWFKTCIADPILKIDRPFIEGVLLNYASLYGIRKNSNEENNIDVFGRLKYQRKTTTTKQQVVLQFSDFDKTIEQRE